MEYSNQYVWMCGLHPVLPQLRHHFSEEYGYAACALLSKTFSFEIEYGLVRLFSSSYGLQEETRKLFLERGMPPWLEGDVWLPDVSQLFRIWKEHTPQEIATFLEGTKKEGESWEFWVLRTWSQRVHHLQWEDSQWRFKH